MKVLYVITGLATGGAEMMLLKLLSTMDRKRFTPTVITLAGGEILPRIEALDIPVYCMDFQPGTVPVTGIFRLVHLLRQLQPDIIQGWMYHGNLAAQITVFFLKKKTPVIWNIRGIPTDLNQEKLITTTTIWLGAKLSRFPVKIINNSRKNALLHEHKLGYFSNNTMIIPNGFDIELFKPSPDAYNTFRKVLNLPADSLLIGLIGRYHPMKDHGNFFHAASQLVKTHPTVRFILAGTEMQPSNVELMNLISSLGLESLVHLLGRRDDMPEIMAALDIASSSSYGEGFSNTIGEAMSCGVPCVVTDVGDSAWIVGDTGKVVPPRDPTALANALRELVDIGAAARRALGKRARQRIVENFSLESVVRQYEDLYTTAFIGNSKGSADVWHHRSD